MAGRALNGADRERRDADRADLALTAAAVGEYEWDIERDEWHVSPRMAVLTGLRAGVGSARLGQALYDHVYGEDLDGVRQAVTDDLRRDGRYDIRFRFVRPDDGRLVWLNSTAVGLKGPGGEFIKAVGVVRDISAEKEEAAQREGLVAELDHRVKNVLASVQSLAAQSARRTVSLEAFLKTFFGRLEAMAAAHTLLTATRWRGAEIGHVAAAELGGLAQGQARWEGPDIVLSPRATHALTLALHELGANAVKYGALSSETGRIEVTWTATPGGGFELVWTERNGPIVTPPTRRGFGSTLLERVTGRELGGTARLDFRPEGLRAVLSAGLSALAVKPEDEPVDVRPEATDVEDSLTGASHGGLTNADIRGVRVLIVEDAVLLALELEAGLIESGASVVATAADIGEAKRMLSLDFDAAVLDANLNGASVTPVAEALARRGVPFIFATGYGDANAAPAGFGVPVVRKPYNVRQIAVALVEAIGRA
jgi:two-component sensor histidine kinase/CheY-like chemotaxis protein